MFNSQSLNKSELQKNLSFYLKSFDVSNSEVESQIIIAHAANKDLFLDVDYKNINFDIELEKLRKENDEADTAALLSAELVALRGRHEEERRQLIKTAQDLRFRNEELEMRCITLQNMVGAGVETTTRSDGDNDDDSSTKLVATLEEQLRNAEHRATVLEQRLNIVKESGDSVIQSLNEELADIAEDRARVEAAMIKELSLLDSQRRTERDEYEKRIQEWKIGRAHV